MSRMRILTISIHAPRTGSDCVFSILLDMLVNFNPRSPHGERPLTYQTDLQDAHFNPRSPHGERQHLHSAQSCPPYFNPRSPHGERHLHGSRQFSNLLISIHAPRTGSDHAPSPDPNNYKQFQSTLPARGATRLCIHGNKCNGFQSTLPARGATALLSSPNNISRFQSTLPARGATWQSAT